MGFNVPHYHYLLLICFVEKVSFISNLYQINHEFDNISTGLASLQFSIQQFLTGCPLPWGRCKRDVLLRESRWQTDEPTSQLARPAVVAATLLVQTPPCYDWTVHVCLVYVNSDICVCVFVCVCVDVSYQWKCMRDFAVGGQLSSKAIGRKELVAVIVLDNLTHCFQGHGICIHLVGTHIVEWGGLGWVTLEDAHTCNKIKSLTICPSPSLVCEKRMADAKKILCALSPGYLHFNYTERCYGCGKLCEELWL